MYSDNVFVVPEGVEFGYKLQDNIYTVSKHIAKFHYFKLGIRVFPILVFKLGEFI